MSDHLKKMESVERSNRGRSASPLTTIRPASSFSVANSTPSASFSITHPASRPANSTSSIGESYEARNDVIPVASTWQDSGSASRPAREAGLEGRSGIGDRWDDSYISPSTHTGRIEGWQSKNDRGMTGSEAVPPLTMRRSGSMSSLSSMSSVGSSGWDDGSSVEDGMGSLLIEMNGLRMGDTSRSNGVLLATRPSTNLADSSSYPLGLAFNSNKAHLPSNGNSSNVNKSPRMRQYLEQEHQSKIECLLSDGTHQPTPRARQTSNLSDTSTETTTARSCSTTLPLAGQVSTLDTAVPGGIRRGTVAHIIGGSVASGLDSQSTGPLGIASPAGTMSSSVNRKNYADAAGAKRKRVVGHTHASTSRGASRGAASRGGSSGHVSGVTRREHADSLDRAMMDRLRRLGLSVNGETVVQEDRYKAKEILYKAQGHGQRVDRAGAAERNPHGLRHELIDAGSPSASKAPILPDPNRKLVGPPRKSKPGLPQRHAWLDPSDSVASHAAHQAYSGVQPWTFRTEPSSGAEPRSDGSSSSAASGDVHYRPYGSQVLADLENEGVVDLLDQSITVDMINYVVQALFTVTPPECPHRPPSTESVAWSTARSTKARPPKWKHAPGTERENTRTLEAVPSSVSTNPDSPLLIEDRASQHGRASFNGGSERQATTQAQDVDHVPGLDLPPTELWQIVRARHQHGSTNGTKAESIPPDPIDLPPSRGRVEFTAPHPDYTASIRASHEICIFPYLGLDPSRPRTTPAPASSSVCPAHQTICGMCHASLGVTLEMLLQRMNMLDRDAASLMGVAVLLHRVRPGEARAWQEAHGEPVKPSSSSTVNGRRAQGQEASPRPLPVYELLLPILLRLSEITLKDRHHPRQRGTPLRMYAETQIRRSLQPGWDVRRRDIKNARKAQACLFDEDDEVRARWKMAYLEVLRMVGWDTALKGEDFRRVREELDRLYN